MIQAVLTNSQHPEYGVVTVPFPIPKKEYYHVMELLAQLGIGDPVARDCNIEEISGDFPALRQLEQTNANLDELDYLAKRLDSFDNYEKAQFQGMASKLGLHGVDELINLTFCCQEATIITDFTNFEKVGRRHFLTLGGGISLEKMQGEDFREIARCLIESEVGYITPYGVTYSNGMELSQIYNGKQFPEYLYEDCMMELELTPNTEPEDTANIAFLYLPMAQTQIERTMLRIGVDNYRNIHFRVMESSIPEEINAALSMEHEGIAELNQMCETIAKLGPADHAKLGAVVTLAQPEYVSQVKNLAENLDLFDFIPNIQTPEEYGRYMIRESGHFEYDDNLEGYYNFAGYGQHGMANEYGRFIPRGYVSYHGSLGLDELMMEEMAEQPVVGKVSFASGEEITYTDSEEYLKVIREELPYPKDLLQDILLGLHSMCEGAESKFFNGHTNVTSDRFIAFGVKGLLQASQNVKNALLFNVLSYMSDRLLTVGNTVAALDELYLFLTNKTVIEYIRSFMKRVRKKESAVILSSQNLEDFALPGIAELTKPLFSIPVHQFLFNAGSVDSRFYMDTLQLEESEYKLIKYPQQGVCLYKCGNERYNLAVHAPEYKETLFGTAGGR